MIFERMSSLRALYKLRQFETLVKPNNSLARCRALTQPVRLSTNISNAKRCLNSAASLSTKSQLLTKMPVLSPTQYRMASTQGSHVKLWVMERIASAALLFLVPAAFMFENPVVDGLLAITVVMHTHWGLEAVIVDYARPIVVGNVLPKVAHMLLNVLSIATLAGLFVLIYNGPGIAKSVKDAWAVGQKKSKSV